MRDLRSTTTAELLVAPAAITGLLLGLVGLLEALFSTAFKLSALGYAFGLYGLIGMAIGFLWGLSLGGRARRRDFGLLWLTSQAAEVPTFLLSLLSAGFLIWRDMWRESLGNAGVVGFLAMAGVLIGAVLCALIAREASRALVLKARLLAVAMLVVASSLFLSGRWIEGSQQSPPEVEPTTNPDERPPIVFVVVDALRADALGAYGKKSEPTPTPNLDAFAQEAVLFENTWSTSTWTRPAVASIMTGQSPAVHATMHKSDQLPEKIPTLAELLTRAGYGAVAAVTNVNLAPEFGLGRGFDVWGYLPPESLLWAPVSARRLFLVEVFRSIRLGFFPGLRKVASYYAEGERVTALAEELIAPYLEAKHSFFAYLHYMEPHDPYFAHPIDGRALARVEIPKPHPRLAPQFRDFYGQEVRTWDGLFGELVGWLRQTGLYDRALIVVTADHGEELGDHNHFWHGTSLYQEVVRVPLLIRFPGGAGAGTESSVPTSLLDLVPTALKIAGVPAPADLPGLALDRASGVPPDRPLFAELDHEGITVRAVTLGGWKLIQANPGNRRGLPARELFDLKKDPSERINRADAEPERSAQLGALLDSYTGQAPARAAPQVKIDRATEEQLRSLGYTQ